MHALGLTLHEFQGLVAGSGHDGRHAHAEDEARGTVLEVFHQLLATGDEAAATAHGLAEGAHPHVHFVGVDTEVFVHAAAGGAQHTKGVGLVHQQHAVVLFLQLDDARQVGDVAVHAEQAFGDDAGALVLAAVLLEHLLQGIAVVVLVGVAVGAGKAGALHQGVVGETVIEDGVAVTEKETQGGDVGGVAAHIGDAVLDTVEVGQGALELAMGRTFAAHQAAGAGGAAEDLGGFGDGFGDLGMGIEVQIVVGGEVDVLLAIDHRGGLSRPLVAQEERVFHAHLGTHFHHALKRQFGAQPCETAGAALLGVLAGVVFFHSGSSQI